MTRRASQRGDVPPFLVMSLLRAARERVEAGHDVCRLEAGQPSTAAPAAVVEAAVAALRETRVGYTDAEGTPALRARIARHYAETYGVAVDPERVLVTTGSSGGFVLSFLAAFELGDRVAVTVPGYPAYRHILTAIGCEVVELVTDATTGWQPTVAQLDAAGPLAGLILASPANPTGTMLSEAQLAELATWCRTHGTWLVSDELYHGITFAEPATTALQVDPDAIVVQSFSKYFSMTGWRLGWLVLPEALVGSCARLAGNLTIAPPTLSQVAAIHAFDALPELDGHVARYRRNRDLLVERLPAAGITDFVPPDGAFYLYADVSEHTDDSVALCERLLVEAGVSCTPGVDFDAARGRRTLRLSFAGATAEIEEAVRRLGRALGG